MRHWIKSGAPWIWLTGGAVTLCMVMVVGLLLLILIRGFGHFWPSDLLQFQATQANGEQVRVLGEVNARETVTAQALREAGRTVPEGLELVTRVRIKQGNRDLTGRDFVWYYEHDMDDWSYPSDALMLERREWGNFYGFLRAVREDGETVATEGAGLREVFSERLRRGIALGERIERIERRDIGGINAQMEQIRLAERGINADQGLTPEQRSTRLAELQRQRSELEAEYDVLKAERDDLTRQAQRDSIVAEVMDGSEVEIPIANIVRATFTNDLGIGGKLAYYADKFWEFLSGYPREANTEGGIFPAIFGTVIMVLIMSVIVSPFGILAAIYLREYARQGTMVRLIRISVYNLAGVPSIVFGVFGLGFFVYIVGGSIDELFYSERLPAPTFGTPGLFWASLTLALLTLPVVIVATEEGLSRIPRSIREGSLALGATKAETLWRIVVPLSAPAMMTGMILAVARAAGEVAPLMLVGVVKLAPTLPVDGIAPYVHLERKIMHLGFHIYDVGFQSPNVEAGRPLVYATAMVLVLLIVALNLTAITIRNHLREKYRAETD